MGMEWDPCLDDAEEEFSLAGELRQLLALAEAIYIPPMLPMSSEHIEELRRRLQMLVDVTE